MENQLITLLRITSSQLGHFVKSKLEEQNIEVFFTNEGLLPGDRYDPDEVLLKVKAKHSEKAVAHLIQLQKEYDLDKVKDNDSFTGLKRILVPVKLSDNCVELCKYAIGLAKKQNAEVKVLYVYPDPTFNEPDRHTASWEKYVRMELKEAHQKAQLKLVNFSKELKEQVPAELFDSAKIHYRMLNGTPVNVISDACKRYNPHLIVMGTKASKKGEGEFMGKTLVKVIDRTLHPVLAVPAGTTFKGKDKLNVMYATNFYDSDNRSLNKLLEILKPYDKKIHCVHIDLQDDVMHQQKVRELNKMLDKEYSEYNIKCILFESETLLSGFENFVKENDIDIITISKVKHSALYKLFHTDLSVELVASDNVPILIYPV